MKIIIERFRRFLKEDKLNQLALFHAKDSDTQTVVLYDPTSDLSDPEVVAAVEIAKTEEPCIPQTYQIEWVFTKKEYRGQGLGEALYGICFSLLTDWAWDSLPIRMLEQVLLLEEDGQN